MTLKQAPRQCNARKVWEV